MNALLAQRSGTPALNHVSLQQADGEPRAKMLGTRLRRSLHPFVVMMRHVWPKESFCVGVGWEDLLSLTC